MSPWHYPGIHLSDSCPFNPLTIWLPAWVPFYMSTSSDGEWGFYAPVQSIKEQIFHKWLHFFNNTQSFTSVLHTLQSQIILSHRLETCFLLHSIIIITCRVIVKVEILHIHYLIYRRYSENGRHHPSLLDNKLMFIISPPANSTVNVCGTKDGFVTEWMNEQTNIKCSCCKGCQEFSKVTQSGSCRALMKDGHLVFSKEERALMLQQATVKDLTCHN